MNRKIRDPNWMTHMWQRIASLLGGIDTRVETLEDAGFITTETDPTVPSWAKQPSKPTYTAQEVGAIATSAKGAASGVAELDSGGKVPSSQLPSYVDDVLEYASQSAFPSTGETGKIYVALDTNQTYRWSGSAYVEISPSIALGETSSTAYRGDRGKAAYDHAQAKGSAFASGLYKITTNAEGHVTGATAVQKSDITALGLTFSDVGALADPAIKSNVDITQADNGLTAAGVTSSGEGFVVKDANSKYIGWVGFVALSNGDTQARFQLYNYYNDTNYCAWFTITYKKDGTITYYVQDQAAFRNAISGQQDMGFYIDSAGYMCQRISTDT